MAAEPAKPARWRSSAGLRRLPDPSVPNMNAKPLIIFDGECALCSASVEFVIARDRRCRFRLTTAQSPVGRQAYVDHDLDPDAMATMIVIADGRAHTESEAILAMLQRLGWPWRAAVALRVVPPSLRNRAYRWIARNRYRWVPRRETCWTPAPEVRDRVV